MSNIIKILYFALALFVFRLQAEVTIEYLNVNTQIQARFATTIIVSKIRNDESSSKEVAFTAELPETAFISNFSMFINDKIVVGDVKEKNIAKIEYDLAKARGESAGHVAQKPRETNTFKISVNVAAQSKAIFNLTYQELLKRVHGVYKHIVNLQPDQVDSGNSIVDEISQLKEPYLIQSVNKVQVDVFITERGDIKNIKIPKFAPKIGEKTNKELLTVPEESDVEIKKTIKDKVSNVQISFRPTQSPLAGQFVVLYDVDRDKTGGDIEVVNGYFVHFIAPEGLTVGSKHIIFVLDHSGSMQGRKMEQLKDAMKAILSDLNAADKFNIIMFSSSVEKWKSESVLVGVSDVVGRAKDYVESQSAIGSTALNDAILESVRLLNADSSNALTSMIMLLTDGQPTEGETNSDRIVSNVDAANTKKYPIHCLAFGEDADYGLLKRISGRNSGIARKIYEDSDAALQITGFFDEIRSPVLKEIKVDYLDENVDVSSVVQDHSKHYYDGGEVVVAGRLKDTAPLDADVKATVTGVGAAGPVVFQAKSVSWYCPDYDYVGYVAPMFWRCCPPPNYIIMGGGVVRWPGPPRCCWPDCCWGYYDYCPPPPPPPPPVTPKPRPILAANTAGGFIERMWAYQSIKKILKQMEINEVGERPSLKQKALDMSLRYHFVTELTSMVVIDPTQTLRTSFEKNIPAKKAEGGSPSIGGAVAPGNFGPDSVSSAGRGDHEKGLPPIAPPPPPPVLPIATTTTRQPTTIGQVSLSGCILSAAFVFESTAEQQLFELARKIIDSLASKFSQNTLVALFSSSSLKAATLHPFGNVLSKSTTLKDATRQSPSALNEDLATILQNEFNTQSASSSKTVVFFVGGNQALQYLNTAATQLKAKYPNMKVLAISTTSGPAVAELQKISGTDAYQAPNAADISDILRC